MLKWAAPAVAGATTISGVPTTVSSSGNSDAFNIDPVQRLTCFLQVGVPTGTNPTIDVVVEVQEPHGTWLAVATFTQLTATNYTYVVAGPGTANTYVLSDQARFRWTLGGTDTPTFPGFKLSAVGRR